MISVDASGWVACAIAGVAAVALGWGVIHYRDKYREQTAVVATYKAKEALDAEQRKRDDELRSRLARERAEAEAAIESMRKGSDWFGDTLPADLDAWLRELAACDADGQVLRSSNASARLPD